MGLLTEHMTRLCGEINSLRQQRERVRRNLAQEARARRIAVSEMRAGFTFSRGTQASKTRAALAAFVSALRSGIGARRRELQADLAGARRVWCAAGMPVSGASHRWMHEPYEPPAKQEKKGKRKSA